MDWIVNGQSLGKMSNFYNRYFRDFGELLTDMEKNGIMLDNQHLVEAEVRAKEERALMLKVRYSTVWDCTPRFDIGSFFSLNCNM